MDRILAAIGVLALAACRGTARLPTTPAATPAAWRVPPQWKSELIPFPLEFAPSIAHRGVEELRFPPGFLEAGAPNRWSYAFVWRLDDDAALDDDALAAELAAYFRGLLVAVDGDKHRLTGDEIAVTAAAAGDRFAIEAHVIDTFGDAQPIDLTGTARRVACRGGGALWVFALAPATSPIRVELDALAAEAVCGQPPVPDPS